MASYGDPDTIKATCGVTENDLGSLPDSDGDGSTTDEFENLISALNERASNLIEKYCHRDFGHHTGATATLDGNGRQSIRLSKATGNEPYYPVTSIVEVRLHGDALDADEYRVDRDNGILERKNARWIGGWENIGVDLEWGYSSPPPAIKEVAEDLVREQLHSAAASEKGKGASSISIDGFSVSFPERMYLSESHKEQLNRFRRVLAV